MRLDNDHFEVLRALARGDTLKAHRDIDGGKLYKLHALDGATVDVAASTMDVLKTRRLIDSNKKFPAATYLLTEAGRRALVSAETPIA
jgi:hypothetical protein